MPYLAAHAWVASAAHRSYAVQDPSTGGCDGAIRFAVPFLQAAAKLNKTVSVGFETNCGVASKTITEKISFCDKGVEALYSTISDVRTYLTNTSLALEHFPCAGQPATPLPPLPANMVSAYMVAACGGHAWGVVAWGHGGISC